MSMLLSFACQNLAVGDVGDGINRLPMDSQHRRDIRAAVGLVVQRVVVGRVVDVHHSVVLGGHNRLRDALARVTLIGIGHGLRRGADNAFLLLGIRERLLALVGAAQVVVNRVGRLLALQSHHDSHRLVVLEAERNEPRLVDGGHLSIAACGETVQIELVGAGVSAVLLLNRYRNDIAHRARLVYDAEGDSLLLDRGSLDLDLLANQNVDVARLGRSSIGEGSCAVILNLGNLNDVGSVLDLHNGNLVAVDSSVAERHLHLLGGRHFVARSIEESDAVSRLLLDLLALSSHGFLDRLLDSARGYRLHLHGAVGRKRTLGSFHDDSHSIARLGGQALGRIALLGLLRHGGCLGLGGGLGLVHLLRGLLRFRAVGLVLGLRLGLFDILQRGDDLSTVSLGGGVGARVVREHGHVQEREHQKYRQQD